MILRNISPQNKAMNINSFGFQKTLGRIQITTDHYH